MLHVICAPGQIDVNIERLQAGPLAQVSCVVHPLFRDDLPVENLLMVVYIDRNAAGYRSNIATKFALIKDNIT